MSPRRSVCGVDISSQRDIWIPPWGRATCPNKIYLVHWLTKFSLWLSFLIHSASFYWMPTMCLGAVLLWTLSSEPDRRWFLIHLLYSMEERSLTQNFLVGIWWLSQRPYPVFLTPLTPSLSFWECSRLPRMHQKLSHASLPLGSLLFKSRLHRNRNDILPCTFKVLLRTSSHVILNNKEIQEWPPFYWWENRIS